MLRLVCRKQGVRCAGLGSIASVLVGVAADHSACLCAAGARSQRTPT